MLTTIATKLSPAEDDPSGDALMVAAAQRDPDAFELLYNRYERRIYAYCLQRLDDPNAADDATSVVFGRAFAKLASCDPRHFRAWLFTIAHHAVADDMRARRRQGRPFDGTIDRPDPADGPEQLALRAEARERLGIALHQLPTDQRRVIELRLAGLTGPEIAAVLGCSHDAIKKRQQRAIARLRDQLA